jgi:hypothetical protein
VSRRLGGVATFDAVQCFLFQHTCSKDYEDGQEEREREREKFIDNQKLTEGR